MTKHRPEQTPRPALFRAALCARFIPLLLGALVLPPASTAQDQAKDGEADVTAPAERHVVNILMPEMRDVLTEIVMTLRQNADTDPDFFFVPPERTRTVVGHREVAVRYTKKTYERPVYEKEYETERYKVVVNKGGGSEQAGGKLETVTRTRRRLVGKKKVGTKTVTRLVRDKNGTIVKTERRRVYGPGGADIHYPGFFGQNAMALYLCAKVGVPFDDDLMHATSHNIANLALAYGLPDRTWDLAWLTLAMVNMPKQEEVFCEAAELAVHRLLLAQTRDGDAEGMWGPVCVDPKTLSTMIRFEQEFYDDEIRKWERKHREDPERDYYKEKFEEEKERLATFREQYRYVSQLGLEFNKAHYRRNSIKPEGDYIYDLQTGTGMDDGRPARVEGWPYLVYGERLTDIASTSMVLFALREAAEAGYLPEKTWIPKAIDGEPLLEPRETAAQFRLAFKALSDRVQEGGMANEANAWQVVHLFDDIPGLGLPYEDDRIESLTNRITFTTTARATAALMDAAALLDDTRGLDLGQFNSARKTHAAMIEAFLTGNLRGMSVGGHPEPYEFVFHSARTVLNPLDLAPNERNLWAWLAEFVLQKKEHAKDTPTVYWLKGGDRPLPTSVKPYLRKDFTANFEESADELTDSEKKKVNRQVGHWRGRLGRRQRNEVVAATYAGIHLYAGLRPPAVGLWSWNGRAPRTNTIAPVLKRIGKEKDRELSHTVIPAAFPPNAASGMSMILLSGTGKFEPRDPESLDRLLAYLAAGGLLAAEAPADAEGIAFLKAIQKEITDRMEGATATRLPPLGEDLPKVIAVKSATGKPVGVFMPIAASTHDSRESVFTPQQAMTFLYTLLPRALPDDYFQSQALVDFEEVLAFEDEMRQKREEAAEAAEEPEE